MHWVVLQLVRYYLNDVQNVWKLPVMWNNLSRIHEDDEHKGKSHQFLRSNYGRLCSKHINNMMVLNRKHWRYYHSLATQELQRHRYLLVKNTSSSGHTWALTYRMSLSIFLNHALAFSYWKSLPIVIIIWLVAKPAA